MIVSVLYYKTNMLSWIFVYSARSWNIDNIDRYVTILWHIILTVSQEVIGFTVSTGLEGKHCNHYTMEMVLLKQEQNNGCIIHK